jgi:hypothetical protein
MIRGKIGQSGNNESHERGELVRPFAFPKRLPEKSETRALNRSKDSVTMTTDNASHNGGINAFDVFRRLRISITAVLSPRWGRHDSPAYLATIAVCNWRFKRLCAFRWSGAN